MKPTTIKVGALLLITGGYLLYTNMDSARALVEDISGSIEDFEKFVKATSSTVQTTLEIFKRTLPYEEIQ